MILVFPHSGAQSALSEPHRRRLSRGQVQLRPDAVEPLNYVLDELGVPGITTGLAALRYLGQTGTEVGGWIAAADPITFQPRLRDIVAHRVPSGWLADNDLEALLASVRDLLGDDCTMHFERIGGTAYLVAAKPLHTATVSPAALHGFSPDTYLPSGGEGRRYHRLHSELQMLFHDHAVNRQRAENNLPAITGLWIWGGGQLPGSSSQNLPTLYSDDPLFTGYWSRFGGERQSWPGSVAGCVSPARDPAVITVPESQDGQFDRVAADALDEIFGMMNSGRIKDLAIIFNNELSARLKWSDCVKFWRRDSFLPAEAVLDD